ncbi:MAG: hypothetical protein JNM75_05265 [Rhodospirillales bacterium]|nr:hypothetical protein [Rhodospirillales bacterium]
MGTFIGTPDADTITTGFVSAGVGVMFEGDAPSDGDDSIYGYAGSDTLGGGGGNDTIDGGEGGDTIDGGTGSDTIRGGPGDDFILGKTPGLSDATDCDLIYGDDGNDVIFGNGGEHDGYSADGADRIYGGAGDDGLYGKLGDDLLYGGDGNDTLGGYYGCDVLFGQNGADRLIGRHDADRLNGGAGNDIYEYVAVTDSTPSAQDSISNFDGVGAPAGDRISLARIDADPGASGDQAFVFIGTAEFTGPGQVRVTDLGPHTLVQANTNDSPEPELQILVKDGAAHAGEWVAGDFIL